MYGNKLFPKFIVLFLVLMLLVGCAARPGTLPDPKDFPAADKSDVGNTVTLSMDKILAQELGQVVFVYLYDDNANTGRLGVLTDYECEKPYYAYMLTVYEPVWSGVENLIPSFDTGFEAKIVDRAIVSFQENQYLYVASHRVSEKTDLKEEEIITENAKNAVDGVCWYFGHVSKEQNDPKAIELQSGGFVSLVGNTEEAAGENVSTAIRNLKNAAKRFKLEASLGI